MGTDGYVFSYIVTPSLDTLKQNWPKGKNQKGRVNKEQGCLSSVPRPSFVISLKQGCSFFTLQNPNDLKLYKVILNNTFQTVHCILKKKYITQYTTQSRNFLVLILFLGFVSNAWGRNFAIYLRRKTPIKTHEPETCQQRKSKLHR